MKYLVLDTETTDLTEDAKIVEIAWCELEIDCGIGIIPGSEFLSYVNPEIPISPSASGVNQIRNEDVQDAPTIDEIDFPTGEICIVGHNIKFDIRYVSPYMNIVDSLCTYLLARRLWHMDMKCEDFKLQTLCAYKNIPRHAAHHADGDVRSVVNLLDHMCETEGKSFQEFLDWMNTPYYYEHVPIGKNRGKKLSEVPKSWFEWLHKQGDVDKDMRHTLIKYFGRER